jgi:hypothetical protein
MGGGEVIRINEAKEIRRQINGKLNNTCGADENKLAHQ